MHAFGEIREAQPASIAIAASNIHLLLDLNFITELLFTCNCVYFKSPL